MLIYTYINTYKIIHIYVYIIYIFFLDVLRILIYILHSQIVIRFQLLSMLLPRVLPSVHKEIYAENPSEELNNMATFLLLSPKTFIENIPSDAL